jgi:hypothetical protein
MAQGVGLAIAAWVPLQTNVMVKGVTTGLVGSGSVSGTLQFVISGQIQAAFGSSGINGPSAPGIALMVENGLSSSLISAQYIGLSVGVGSGTDISKINQANSSTLISLLLGNLKGMDIDGISTSLWVPALASGVSAIFLTGFGFGSVSGIGVNFPSSGTSISTVL